MAYVVHKHMYVQIINLLIVFSLYEFCVHVSQQWHQISAHIHTTIRSTYLSLFSSHTVSISGGVLNIKNPTGCSFHRLQSMWFEH
jgi:hypothetical protein